MFRHNKKRNIYQCALKYDADDIVRFAADNPLAEAAEIDRLIEYYLTNHKPNCLIGSVSTSDSAKLPRA